MLRSTAALGALLAGSLAPGLAPAQSEAQDIPQAGNAWFTDAQSVLEQKLSVRPINNRARNVILMISDGNGVGTNTATRIWHGQQNGMMGEENVLPFEEFPYLALSKTYNVNAQTPDSAGTGTAMMSGVKTKIGIVGVDESLTRGDCAAVAGARVASIAEILAAQGKAVGFVTTARATHATPASVYAHAADRNFEDDSQLPEGCEVPDIAAQLFVALESGLVDVAMGGGRRHFLPEGVEDPEGRSGRRTDGRNIPEEVTALGGQYAHDDATFAEIDLETLPILGLFEASHMKYEYDRTGEPSLAEMTEAAITALQGSEAGFFLQVEAGRVDHANHASNLHRVVTDGVAFAEAVAVAAEMTDPEETLIIVTADHEHSMGFNGYCGRGTPITGLCYDVDPAGVEHSGEPVVGSDGKPYTAVAYLNGPGAIVKQQEDGSYSGSRPDLTQEEATDPEYIQQATVPKNSETHSAEDVAIYARGPYAHLISGTVEQNFIFHVMHYAATIDE